MKINFKLIGTLMVGNNFWNSEEHDGGDEDARRKREKELK
jgi:hypothetical protein